MSKKILTSLPKNKKNAKKVKRSSKLWFYKTVHMPHSWLMLRKNKLKVILCKVVPLLFKKKVFSEMNSLKIQSWEPPLLEISENSSTESETVSSLTNTLAPFSWSFVLCFGTTTQEFIKSIKPVSTKSQFWSEKSSTPKLSFLKRMPF